MFKPDKYFRIIKRVFQFSAAAVMIHAIFHQNFAEAQFVLLLQIEFSLVMIERHLRPTDLSL